MMTSRGSFINFDNFHDTPAIQKRAMNSAVEGGPNSGFEIEGIDFFKDPETANEFPEMKDDIDLVISTESLVRRMVDFRNRVVTSKGMSRGMAYELNELIPDMQAFNAMHYTQDLSNIQYMESMEALSASIWALIAAAVAVVVGIIYKFINWITGGSGGSGGGGGGGGGSSSPAQVTEGIHEAKAAVKVQVAATKVMEKEVVAVEKSVLTLLIPSATNHDEIQRSHLPIVAKEEIIEATNDLMDSVSDETTTVSIEVEVAEEMNRIMEDEKTAIRFNSTTFTLCFYSKNESAIDAMADSFALYEDVAIELIKKMHVLEALMAAITSGQDATASEMAKELDTLMNTGVFHGAPIDIGGLKVADELDWVARLDAATKGFVGAKVPTNYQEAIVLYNAGYERMGKIDWRPLDRVGEMLEVSKKTLDKMYKVAKEAHGNAVDEKNKVASDNAAIARHAITQIQVSLVSLMKVYSFISSSYVQVSRDGYWLFGLFLTHLKKMESLCTRYDEPVPADLAEGVRIMEEKLAEWKENPLLSAFKLRH